MERIVLLAWEMGAGLGHTRRLLAVANALRDDGFEPVLAQKKIQTLAYSVREAGIAVVPTPPVTSLAPKDALFRASTYADIMAITGYADPDILEAALGAWDGLLRFINPSAIVGDYCPILPMAARGRVPFLAFGDGFVVPPHEPPDFPPLSMDGIAMKSADAIKADANILLRKRGQPRIQSLGQLVAGDAQVVCTFPELDIYSEYRTEPALGPLNELPSVRPPPAEKRLFVYLSAEFAGTMHALKAVMESEIPAEGFIRDASPGLRQTLCDGGMTLHDKLPDLAERLSHASVILHHGGIGTMETALAMGCPQLLMTRHLEQQLNAVNLKQYHVCRILKPDDKERLGYLIQYALNDDTWQNLAQELAIHLNARRPFSCINRLVDKVKMLAA